MRINQFVAQATGLSRRAADQAISDQRVQVNGQAAPLGYNVQTADTVTLDDRPITPAVKTITIILNKPTDYVVSREGQGSKTIYDVVPPEYHRLKPVGRLDKGSSGLLLLTNDGELANQLTHPRYGKTKVYGICLDKPLVPADKKHVEQGVELDDGPSRLSLEPIGDDGRRWQVTMAEGRNRQVRRTFEALGYKVTVLHRTQFGSYALPSGLKPGEWAQAPQPPRA